MLPVMGTTAVKQSFWFGSFVALMTVANGDVHNSPVQVLYNCTCIGSIKESPMETFAKP